MRLSSIAAFVAATLTATPGLARTVRVRDSAGLARAITDADPGDDIVIADGRYVITGKLRATANATSAAPITVRAEHPLRAHIASSAVIAFEVTGTSWHFAGLDISGVCAQDTDCEHAFHVVGNAADFRLADSRLADFNAHIKVNSNAAHELPARGLIENSEVFDSHPRHTDNPVVPINIDNAVGWIVRGNLIHDFQKDGTGEGSYGAFVKGGAQTPLLERNLVLCARDHPALGQMVGLSFGAHGMDANLCPPHWDAHVACDPEVQDGTMRNNIVASCTDDGIYLNKAARTRILFNTLVNTRGIDVRFPGSTGIVRGNLLNGAIAARDGATFTDGGNVSGNHTAQALADWFRQTPRATPAPLLHVPGPDADVPGDFCGQARGASLDVGAIQVSRGGCTLPH